MDDQLPEPTAWFVRAKNGMERACWTKAPDQDQLDTAAYDGDTVTPLVTIDQLKQAVAAEREACATLCASLVTNDWDRSGSEEGSFNIGCEECAAAIRARSSKKQG